MGRDTGLFPGRFTWVEVDLDRVAANVRSLCRHVGPAVALMAVVKADGYGHGAVEVARTALAAGARWLGVAVLQEAVALRRAGIEAPILILGYTPPEQAGAVVEHDLIQAVFSREACDALAAAAAARGKKARVHLKVDSGMGRLGVTGVEEALALGRYLTGLPALDPEGIFTHLAVADEVDRPGTVQQLRRFLEVTDALGQAGLTFRLRHVANSAATIAWPETHLDMVRVGLSAYGLYPAPSFRERIALAPAMSWKARIVMVKRVPRGSGISYGWTYVAPAERVIATVPAGYADGYNRLLSNRGYVLVRGRRAPVTGRVCMDQFMCDVTGIQGVEEGDEVVLLGRQGEEEITAEDLAAALGTINYEVVCAVSRRVPRVYREGACLRPPRPD